MNQPCQWKTIVGYDNYEVSEDGRVWNKTTDAFLKGSVNNCVYVKVCLSKDGKAKHFQMHRLVAQAFVPNPKAKEYVRHRDGNLLNNDAENLYWQSYEEFQLDPKGKSATSR